MNDDTQLGKIDAILEAMHGMQDQVDGLICLVSDLDGRLTRMAAAVAACTHCGRPSRPGVELCGDCALEVARRLLDDGGIA
jgi:hypothetical protein